MSGVICTAIDTSGIKDNSVDPSKRAVEMKRKQTISSNGSNNNNLKIQPQSSITSAGKGGNNHSKSVNREKGVILLNKQVRGLKNAAAARKQTQKY